MKLLLILLVCWVHGRSTVPFRQVLVGLLTQNASSESIQSGTVPDPDWKALGLAGIILLLYALLMYRLSGLTWGLWYDGLSLLTLLILTEPVPPNSWSGLSISVLEPGSVSAGLEDLLQRWLRQWISPLFWFVFLGPVGLLVYGIVGMMLPANARNSGFWLKIQLVLDWLPGRCMALAVALLTHFMDRLALVEQRFLVFEDSVPLLALMVQLGIQAGIGKEKDSEHPRNPLETLMHQVSVFALIGLALLTIYAL